MSVCSTHLWSRTSIPFKRQKNCPAHLNEKNCGFGISWLKKKTILIESCRQFSNAFERVGFDNYSSIYVTF